MLVTLTLPAVQASKGVPGSRKWPEHREVIEAGAQHVAHSLPACPETGCTGGSVLAGSASEYLQRNPPSPVHQAGPGSGKGSAKAGRKCRLSRARPPGQRRGAAQQVNDPASERSSSSASKPAGFRFSGSSL